MTCKLKGLKVWKLFVLQKNQMKKNMDTSIKRLAQFIEGSKGVSSKNIRNLWKTLGCSFH